MRKIERVLRDMNGKQYIVKDLDDSFHTANDSISKEELQKTGLILSEKGKKYFCLKPGFADLWDNLERGPQIITRKDIGLILARTGVNGSFTCVDAGGGSGSLCLSLANVCKEITVYEINPEHHDVIARNVKLFGVDNLTLKQGNVYDGISEKEVDLITLDLPEPWKVDVKDVLVKGGHVVVYLPNLQQVKTFLDNSRGLTVVDIVELLQRKWKITDKIMRPEFEMLGHTGFLIFCRKF